MAVWDYACWLLQTYVGKGAWSDHRHKLAVPHPVPQGKCLLKKQAKIFVPCINRCFCRGIAKQRSVCLSKFLQSKIKRFRLFDIGVCKRRELHLENWKLLGIYFVRFLFCTCVDDARWCHTASGATTAPNHEFDGMPLRNTGDFEAFLKISLTC